MATIDINDAYILNETGAQVDKVTGLFYKDESTTAAEKAFAQLNVGASLDLGITGATIGQMPVVASVDGSGAPTSWNAATPSSGGGGGRNLLDNGWFRVNQRGWTSGNMGSMQYWADRWHMNTDASNPSSLSLNNGVVTITTPSGTNRFGNILQTLADPDAIVGKVVTLSVLKSDDTIISGTITRTAATTQDAYNEGGIILRLSSTNRFNVQVEAGKTLSIKAVKLEIGSTSTLAQDAPPDYGEELAKCQYYFRRVSGDVYLCSGMAVNTTVVVFPFPFTMRTNPTITITGTISAVGSGGILAVSSVNSVGKATNAIQVRLTVSGATQYGAYLLTPSNGGYLDFTADL